MLKNEYRYVCNDKNAKFKHQIISNKTYIKVFAKVKYVKNKSMVDYSYKI